MTTDVQVMASVQDKVRERIQQAFMDLIPEELWGKMVAAEIQQFTQKSLPELVRHAAKERLMDVLKAEFQKPEWADKWGGQGPLASDAVTTILKDVAPDLVAAWFGSLAQQIVSQIRNGGLRAY